MQRARTGLQKIVSDALRRAPAEERPLLAWPMVCGAAVAARTRALDFAGGVLRVEVPDAAWCDQLSALAPRYLDTLNRNLGAQVERISFVTAEQKKPPRSSR
jgi:predicted nucleic acid-binding Zn ribbon protein